MPLFPNGKISSNIARNRATIPVREDLWTLVMKSRIQSTSDLSELIRKHRKALGMTQADLAGASGLGPRFIGDLERGKPTCEIGKTLLVLKMLGIEVTVSMPTSSDNE